MQKRKYLVNITHDFLINIIASTIYTFSRQIVVFPILASRLTDADYGTLLTVMGLVNVCTAIIGSTLNNIRLVQNSEYLRCGIRGGDFNHLCILGSCFSIAFSFILWSVFKYSWLTALLLTAYILVSNLYHYASSLFRIDLNFKRILIANCLVSAAYIASTFLFATVVLWPAVFLMGEGIGLVFVAKTTKFYKESFSRTPLYRQTRKKVIAFMISNLVGNLLMYADRMIIYPVLGAESVSYYSTAAFFGKSAGIVMTPIAGVLLGYYAQDDFVASKRLFTVVNCISLLLLSLFMAVCWCFAPLFTKILYPTLYLQASPYLVLANFASVVSIAGNMAQPMILRCCDTKYVLAVQILYAVVYIMFSAVLIPRYALFGFCWAAISANGLRLLALYGLGYWKL